MGHRVSANLFRVGRLRSWNSQWFAKSEYTYLISLDYRIRDFIDYLFYNLKWPSSELKIKRFLSRTVILELVIFISDDRLLHFLKSINFMTTYSKYKYVDLFKFNSLALDSNYVFFNLLSNVWNKSVFYVYIRMLREYQLYDLSLVYSIYKKLFVISNFNLKGISKKYIYDIKNTILYQYSKCNTVWKSIMRQFLKFKGKSIQINGTLHFLRNLINIIPIMSTKLYLGTVRQYLLFLRKILLVRYLYLGNYRQYNRNIYLNINTFLCNYNKFNIYNRFCKYYVYSKQINYRYSKVSIIPTNKNFNMIKSARLIKFKNDNKKSKRIQNNKFKKNNSKSKIDSIKLKNNNKFNDRYTYLKNKHEIQQKCMSYRLFKNILKIFKKKKKNYIRIPYFFFKRNIFYWLINSIHNLFKFKYSFRKFKRFNVLFNNLNNKYSRKIRFKSLYLRNIYKLYRIRSKHRVNNYKMSKRKMNKRDMRKYKVNNMSNVVRKRNLVHISKIFRNDLCIVNSINVIVRFFFFSGIFWYFNFGACYFQKISLLYKDIKLSNFNLFYKVYFNLSNIILLRKLIDFFNFFKFENSIFISIKFLRYYKKLYLHTNIIFYKLQRMRTIVLFLLFMYYYVTNRYCYIQLFLKNFLNSTIYLTHGSFESSNYREQICVYLFIYYFFNHVRLLLVVINVLQLITIFKIYIEILLHVKRNVSILLKNKKSYCKNLKFMYCSITKLFVNKYNYLSASKPKLVIKNSKFNLYNNTYIIIYNMSVVQFNIFSRLNTYCVQIDLYSLSNFTVNSLYLSLFKIMPMIIKRPYFKIEYEFFEGNINQNFKSNKIKYLPRSIISTQFKDLLLYKTKFLFRYIINRFLLHFEDVRRDFLPVSALQTFSSMVEYTLFKYLKNKIIFLPIYYLGKKISIKQAKIVCLYIVYELENKMPYFLILKQISWNSNYIYSGKQKKYYFKTFNNVFFDGILKLDKYLAYHNKREFNLYKLNMQCTSILKYYLFRTFRSISMFRGFIRRVGMRIACSGRMYRRHTRSHTMWFVKGALPLRTFDRYIDYYSSYAVTRLGTIGVKTWIYLAQFISLH